jgi:2,4-dienoyl-CoA reductase (NADPH2)
MMAALTAHRRGHQVTLCEAGDRLGGQLWLAGAPPGRGEFLQLAQDLANQVRAAKIAVMLNQTVDPDLIEEKAPDHVLVATGARPLTLSIPGVDLAHVVDAWEVLAGRADTGRQVAIIGGGAVGVETALFLAEKGTLAPETLKFLVVNQAESLETLFKMATCGSKQIVLLEMMDRVGKDIGKSTKWGMLQDLARLGIRTVTGARVTRVTPAGLTYLLEGKTVHLDVDSVVTAAGSVSHNPLEAAIKKMDIPCTVVGDAAQVATAFEAIHAGFTAALTL